MKQTHFLDFEKQIAELSNKISDLKNVNGINITTEITQLQNKVDELKKEIYDNLTPWQIVQVARHIQRPRTLDYINNIFTDFTELNGDRHYANDKSIIAGIGRINDQSVAIIGHQKGRDTKENLERNFGMPRPEGYRKALRIMHLAQKFKLPLITFIDTNGAYPGIGAEERNQSEAIGRNLYEMTTLRTPIIVNVIGEGGSGGALAIAVGDQINMLEYAIYSVITPEGCASILWKNSAEAAKAAQILGITANKLKELNLIDEIIKEPQGGAHVNHSQIITTVKNSLLQNLKKLQSISTDQLLAQRLERIMNYGVFSTSHN